MMNSSNANGTTYDPQAYLAARELMQSAPLSLTPADFAQLEAVDPALVTQAHQLRRIAGHPSDPPAAALHTKSADVAPTFLGKPGKKGVTYRALDAVLDCIFDVLKKDFKKLEQRNEKLEQRVKELEARPALKYCGPYIEKQLYSEGNLVSKNGGLWLAIRPNPEVPGDPGSGWKLIVKSGDAR